MLSCNGITSAGSFMPLIHFENIDTCHCYNYSKQIVDFQYKFPIYIKTIPESNGKYINGYETILIYVDNNTYIYEIKYELYSNYGIDVYDIYNLTFWGNKLNDSNKLSECNIYESVYFDIIMAPK